MVFGQMISLFPVVISTYQTFHILPVLIYRGWFSSGHENVAGVAVWDMASTQPTHPEAMSDNSSNLALPTMHPSPSLSSVSSKKSSKRDSNRSDDAQPLDSVNY